MTKSDLREGMKVRYRDSRLRTLGYRERDEELVFFRESGAVGNWMRNYSEDMLFSPGFHSRTDIMEIYSRHGDLMWAREEDVDASVLDLILNLKQRR